MSLKNVHNVDFLCLIYVMFVISHDEYTDK